MFSNISMTITTGMYLYYHVHPYVPYRTIAQFMYDKYRKSQSVTIETQTELTCCHDIGSDFMYVDWESSS